MLRNLFRQRPDERQGDALYAVAVEQARQPAFYTALGVADRIDARFELYTLHVLILFLRLKQDGERGEVAAQKLFDTYISSLDNTLRELGVGDVSVGKKMRKLGESLYGRMNAYEGPLRAEDVDALAASLAKNIYESADAETGRALARYAVASRQNLTAQSFETVSKAPAWAEITA
ncbi:ubiquinol-cytochrome C chaperone family protein [Brevundimonas bullata]|jgi:cytochrome b pre-mRNA-processing protein 3|uniref:ubiquinol-cytochrome C chaperone family protein n=1 Tax=Brevundimonas bullata TaxID=13160 RepID=UPI000E0A7A32|nr:ubiquinol-cytochrome C chaperone family protein [Brevundimonas bullata]MBD3833770.1 ubiquinol-cytochrome C chaperone [Brevundimonas sp.]WQE38059.1 ubiquinol-cytochrome C chaperone family protein [Brevundimonas bullata]